MVPESQVSSYLSKTRITLNPNSLGHHSLLRHRTRGFIRRGRCGNNELKRASRVKQSSSRKSLISSPVSPSSIAKSIFRQGCSVGIKSRSKSSNLPPERARNIVRRSCKKPRGFSTSVAFFMQASMITHMKLQDTFIV